MLKLPRVWDEPFDQEIMNGLRCEAAKRFRRHQLPESAGEWSELRPELLRRFTEAINIEIDHSLDLDVRETGRIQCDGYTIRKICYQSIPGVYVPATLFVPAGDGPFPAIVNMHGHWPQGRIAAAVQMRGHVFARRGYVVISMDAFGSGERDLQPGKFKYHGASLGGALLNVGETLMGRQIVDNMRAVDLLSAMPEVDAGRIGATGASGGGNQTMYLSAFDERIKAAVPVVSVGSFQSYVGGSNCVCELIPDGLDIGEESAILALSAPRPLLICNALHEINPTFYFTETMRSVNEAAKVYRALGAGHRLTARAFNMPHDYGFDAVRAALGFFDFYLKDEGHGMDSETLPEFESIAEKELMTYPSRRFSGVKTIPEYLDERMKAAAARASGEAAELPSLLRTGDEKILRIDFLSRTGEFEKYAVETTRGRMLPFLWRRGNSSDECLIASAPGGKAELESCEEFQSLLDTGASLLVFDQWGDGECGYADEMFPIIGHRKQHQLARSLIWLGRRLMGEWTNDYLLACEFVSGRLPSAEIHLFGRRDSGLAALFCGVLQGARINRITMVDSPAGLADCCDGDDLYMTMACMIPGFLKWGDVSRAKELASCPVNAIRPRRFDGSIVCKRKDDMK